MPKPLLKERPPPAKERARLKAEAKAEAERKAIEDASWADTRPARKSDIKKAQRASSSEEAQKRKAERKALEAAEAAELAKRKQRKSQKDRKTQYEIMKAGEEEQKEMEARRTLSRLQSAKITLASQYEQTVAAPNRNRDADLLEASGVDNALRVLDQAGTPVGTPSRTLSSGPPLGGAAGGAGVPMTYKMFEASRMPSIKLDKPGLKASQYREIIKKEWQRSALNPNNA
eukprot:m.440993 g.440993  ORF g.440993 m.440993 type:complete len:230 (+) comp18601_c0_seq1:249-938(+)